MVALHRQSHTQFQGSLEAGSGGRSHARLALEFSTGRPGHADQVLKGSQQRGAS